MTATRTWIGGGLLAAAGLSAVAAIALNTSGGEQTSGATAAPLRSLEITTSTELHRATRPTTTTAPTTTIVATTTTLPLSPLNSLVGSSVPVVPAAPVVAPAPTRITIDALGIAYPVRGVALEPDGQLEIPDQTEVGWYRLGAAPTEAGSTVLAGHVSWNRVDGPFRDLVALEPGAVVRLDLDDGRSREYQVVERAQYPKLELPAARIWASAGPETLVLITCGGDFNPDIRRYRDNIVVYAVPIS